MNRTRRSHVPLWALIIAIPHHGYIVHWAFKRKATRDDWNSLVCLLDIPAATANLRSLSDLDIRALLTKVILVSVTPNIDCHESNVSAIRS